MEQYLAQKNKTHRVPPNSFQKTFLETDSLTIEDIDINSNLDQC